jgi:patatin-like phospholipase/acyl hydrolase
MAEYRILSIDGGGIRGLLSARLLERIELERPGTLDAADLLAGTSTGGIISLGLASGLGPSDLVRLYRDHGNEVFDDSFLDDVKDLWKLTGADYSSKKLKKRLEIELGATKRLNQLGGRRVLITSFDLDNRDDPRKDPDDPRSWKPKFFHNFPGPDSDGKELVVDVAMRTAAAPTYFPSYQGYIDGGVVANNPSVAALAQALDGSTGGQQLADIRMLSLGTGLNPTYIGRKRHDWGYAQWVKHLIPLMMDGVMGVADYQCGRLLGNHYHRLDTLLKKPIPMDDVTQIPRLLKAADDVDLEETVDWIDEMW